MKASDDTLLEARLAALADRAQPSPDGWARIETRARRHDQRRRIAVAATLSVAVALAAVVIGPRLGAKGGATGVSVSAPTVATTPKVAISAGASSAGASAWVSHGQLWLSRGSGAPHPVAGSAPAADPAWSPDAQWVSYLRNQGTNRPGLWVVHPDGTGNRQLWSGQPGGIEWSPTADELAVSDAPAVGIGGLVILTPGGSHQQVVNTMTEANSFSWSPDGQSIAYSAVLAPAATYRSPLDIVSVHGPDTGQVSTVLRASAGDGIAVGPWWRDGKGLLYWVEPQYSRGAEEQGLELMSVGLTGSAPVTLTTTLVSPAWLAWAPDGRILVVSGGGQQPSDNKTLMLCSPTSGACTPVPTPAHSVALDPAWSPDGQQLAFVVAGASDSADQQWYATRRLWVADFDDLGAAHPIAGASAGAALPSWSADGHAIGYTTATGVEVIGAGGGHPVVVSGGTALSGNDGLDGETAFGKSAWAGHAVWAP